MSSTASTTNVSKSIAKVAIKKSTDKPVTDTTTTTPAKLPKASELRDVSTKAREVEQVSRSQQASERNARLSDLGEQLTQLYLSHLTPEKMLAAAQAGHHGLLVGVAKPPTRITQLDDKGSPVLDDKGQTVKVPCYSADQTHFAGYKPGVEIDHSKGGVPLMALLQGFPNSSDKTTDRTPDPSTLPEGLTVIDRLNAVLLADAGKGEDGHKNTPMVARTQWNARDKCREVYVVWDVERWDHQQAEAEARRQAFKQNRRGGGDFHGQRRGGADQGQGHHQGYQGQRHGHGQHGYQGQRHGHGQHGYQGQRYETEPETKTKTLTEYEAEKRANHDKLKAKLEKAKLDQPK